MATKTTTPVLSPEVAEYVATLKATRGVQWRAWVRKQWATGRDSGTLRVLRNAVGPSGLAKL